MSQYTSNGDKVVLAATILYNPNSESDYIRANLTTTFIKIAKDLGHEVVLSDGGSHPDLVNEFVHYGACVIPRGNKKFGFGKRHAIKQACNLGDIIFLTESEKTSFASQVNKIVKPIVERNADLVVPKRKSMDSYPTSQKFSEQYINTVWKELTEVPLDISGGGRVFRKELAKYFLEYKSSVNAHTYGDLWESIFLPVMDMIVNRRRIYSVEIDYTHPLEQTKIEEGNIDFIKKRWTQLENLIPAFIGHWESLHKKS